jgi:DNA helicase-2/ATP-dependent DNA helicase PcrA
MVERERIKPLQFFDFLGAMIASGKDEDEAEVSSDDRAQGVVSLYSIHKAKGREFPVVIIPNCDMPLNRAATLPKVIFKEMDNSVELGLRSDFLGKDVVQTDLDYERLLQRRVQENLEEEIRVFYVACTRAKHMLILACRGTGEDVRRGEGVSWARWVRHLE